MYEQRTLIIFFQYFLTAHGQLLLQNNPNRRFSSQLTTFKLGMILLPNPTGRAHFIEANSLWILLMTKSHQTAHRSRAVNRADYCQAANHTEDRHGTERWTSSLFTPIRHPSQAKAGLAPSHWAESGSKTVNHFVLILVEHEIYSGAVDLKGDMGLIYRRTV